MTVYRQIGTAKPVRENGLLKVPPEALRDLAFEAFSDVSRFLRSSHLAQLRAVFDSPDASPNERFVAGELLKNAVIAARGVLPLCQDTGTAVVIGQKGHLVLTDGNDAADLSEGVGKAYRERNLRYSQNVPSSLFVEKNSKTNLPAAIELEAVKGDSYRFLFIAKGGGSANKTFLFQETRALLNRDALLAFLTQKAASLGVAACPPYHLAVVVGGLTAEQNLKTVKLASAHALDDMRASENGLRDTEFEKELLEAVNANGLGAQFGGRHFCLDVRVIRLPRHGASLPVGIGVSCVADRNITGYVSEDGVFLEVLEQNPEKFLPPAFREEADDALAVDLDKPLVETLALLKGRKTGTRLSLTGTLIVARDIAHARFKALLDEGKPLPDYLKRWPVYYAGPAKTPAGSPCGSFGPTTAGRMDPYVDLLQENGASMIMLAKGNRSKAVRDACRKHGGFYLGTPGGAAALTATRITACECVDFADLGMEAVWKIRVENQPAFILINDEGEDFYEELARRA